MAKKTVNQLTTILPGFDLAKLRAHVEDADRRRQPTQEELASGYLQSAAILDLAAGFPASIEEIVKGICDQDPRFLDQGRRLLTRLLRKSTPKDGEAEQRVGGGPRRRRPTPTVKDTEHSKEAPAAASGSVASRWLTDRSTNPSSLLDWDPDKNPYGP